MEKITENVIAFDIAVLYTIIDVLYVSMHCIK